MFGKVCVISMGGFTRIIGFLEGAEIISAAYPTMRSTLRVLFFVM